MREGSSVSLHPNPTQLYSKTSVLVNLTLLRRLYLPLGDEDSRRNFHSLARFVFREGFLATFALRVGDDHPLVSQQEFFDSIQSTREREEQRKEAGQASSLFARDA